jgi:hypothetical protein
MLTDIRIGQPASFGSLAVFPLFCEANRPVDYLLSDEAMEAGTVTVGEVSQQGSVPELSVQNRSAQRVLFLEGEQLVGAKQNRILNTSVLVPARPGSPCRSRASRPGAGGEPVPTSRPASTSAPTTCATA